MRIVFFVSALRTGGAERQLVLLAKRLTAGGHQITIATRQGGGPYMEDLTAHGVEVCEVPGGIVATLHSLRRLVSARRADIVHGYLPVPNILALAVGWTQPNVRVVWGIRASNMRFGWRDWKEKVVRSLETSLARFPDAVIVNARASARELLRRGFPQSRLYVIPNGIDATAFHRDLEAGRHFRTALGIPTSSFVIGHVGRLDPMKDHATFLDALQHFKKGAANFTAVCVVAGGDDACKTLREMADARGLSGHVHVMPGNGGMLAAFNAFNCLCSSSAYGEGFPNVVGEAMACGVPCVVTDVGDAAALVGQTGIVVPPQTSSELAKALTNMQRRLATVGAQLRQETELRIAAYSPAQLAGDTERLLLTVTHAIGQCPTTI
jgi:glycosyltransferase involved in cell wall biosynthesis